MTKGMPGFSENKALPTPVAECFVGYRTWIVGGDRLLGMTKKEYAWVDGKNVAKCLRSSPSMHSPATLEKAAEEHREEGIPTLNCGCGFWAYSGNNMPKNFPARRASGVIEAWGKIITGPLGFRAQFARIVAVCPHDWDKELTEIIAEQYPSVIWYTDTEEMLWLHESTDLSHLASEEDWNGKALPD